MISYLQIRTDVGAPEARPIVMQGWGSASPFPEEPNHRVVEATVPNGCPPSGDEWDGAYYDEIEELAKARPSLPPIQTGSAPLVLVLIGLPNGTSVKLANEAGQTMNVGVSENVTLLNRGSYTVEMTPPFPWIPIKTKLEVS